MASYFDRIVKPCFNELLNIIPGKKGPKPYFKLIRSFMRKDPVVLSDAVIVLTTKCSLKCINCNNLMPCYRKPYDIPLKEVLWDIKRLISASDLIVKLTLIGGEPFLYPHLGKVLDAVLDNPKILYISLTTNGTILPSEELLQKLSHPKVVVQISDYGVKTQKVEKLHALLVEHGIASVPDKVVSWVKPGGTEYRGKGRKQLCKEYQECFSSKYCRTLLKGKFYLCARGAHLSDLGYMKSSHDEFNIRSKRTRTQFRKEFLRYLLSDYADACNYCDHGLKITVKPGEQVTAGSPME
ncbi:MAG: radical SAM protein [Lachnospiraceae bacterium]|nr:radical SAM protein [Lachnospiraceae bacterium]